jgi:hypothetical protein
MDERRMRLTCFGNHGAIDPSLIGSTNALATLLDGTAIYNSMFVRGPAPEYTGGHEQDERVCDHFTPTPRHVCQRPERERTEWNEAKADDYAGTTRRRSRHRSCAGA